MTTTTIPPVPVDDGTLAGDYCPWVPLVAAAGDNPVRTQNAALAVPGTLLKAKSPARYFYCVASGRKEWRTIQPKEVPLLVLPGACERVRRTFDQSPFVHQVQLPVLWGEQHLVLWLDCRDLEVKTDVPLAYLFVKVSP